MLFALHLIAQQFNKEKITWALGGSNVLKKYGIVETVNDIDIIVMEKDVKKANRILSTLGAKIPSKLDPLYKTSFYSTYEFRNIKIDLICDFKIVYKNQVYTYQFDELSITDTDDIAKVNIFYTSIEDWYVLYRLMGRDTEEKVLNLEKHFMLHGIKHLKPLLRTLEKVPKDLKTKIKYQLNL
jgi:hypothetical protein